MSSSGPLPFEEATGDEAILNFIFSGSGPGAIYSSQQNSSSISSDPDGVAAREADAVRLAEAGEHETALGILHELCSLHPQRPSTFNNRAQVLKLLGRPDAQKHDMDRAIDLAHACIDDDRPEPDRIRAKNTLKQAFLQRSVYYHDLGDEDAARADLAAAAACGSVLARIATTSTNPYASICHAAVEKMLELQLPHGRSAESQGIASGTRGIEPQRDAEDSAI